jgi:hypothetical protein
MTKLANKRVIDQSMRSITDGVSQDGLFLCEIFQIERRPGAVTGQDFTKTAIALYSLHLLKSSPAHWPE